MTKADLFSNLELENVEPPAATAQTNNTAIVTTIVDMQGFQSVLFAILLGTMDDAAFTTTFLMEDGDDSALSDAAAVADSFLYGTEAGAAFIQSDDDKVRAIGYHGPKRFVRLTITPADNTGDIPIGITAIKSPTRAAVTQNT